MVFKTLPARYYTSVDVYRAEIERFYFNRWICAGRANAIPNSGDYFLREVSGESLIILRDSNNAVRSFYNVCRHRGTRICTEDEGSFGGRMQCPYHGGTYSLEGRLLGAPHMGGAGFSRDQYPLHEVHSALWDGHVFLHSGVNPAPLIDQLGVLRTKFAPWRMEELCLYKRIVYDVKANWKLLILNYSECLHCPVLHPALDRLTDYLGADNEAPTDNYIGGTMGFNDGVGTMSIDGKRRRDYLPGLGAREQKLVSYYAIYPNLLLSLHPDYMMVHTLWPKAVDHTQVVCEWHFHPAELAKPTFYADDAIEFWDTTNREDWHIVELSQAGIQSRAYTPGPYSIREELLHAFDEVVVKSEREEG